MSAPISISQTFSNLTNITYLEDDVKTTMRIIQALTVSVIMFCIQISNILILLVVISSKSYRCPQGILLASLACCDLSVGLLVVPSSFIASVKGVWVLGDVWCLISGSSVNILTGVTAIHITAISLDKYLKVVFPYKYHQNNESSTTVALAFVLIIWIFSCLLIIIPSVVFPGSYTFYPGPLVCISNRWENILLSCFMLGIAIFTNLVLNTKLLLVARRSSRKINQGNGLGVRRQDTKGIRTVLMVNITFMAAYLPGVLVYVYRYLFRAPVSAYVAFIVTWLLISSNFFNSIVYYKSNANFRKAFRRAMFRVLNSKLSKICTCCWSSVAPGVDMSHNIPVTTETL